MNNIESQADLHLKKYPHYKTYEQCQSRAFMKGTFAMVAGTSGGYIFQELLKKYLWYGRKSFFLTSIILGSCAGYSTVRYQTKICQDMWMALEDKHTSLQTVTERLQTETVCEKTL